MSSGPGLGAGKGVRHEGNLGAGGKGCRHKPKKVRTPEFTCQASPKNSRIRPAAATNANGTLANACPPPGASGFTFLQSLPLLIIRNPLIRVPRPPAHPGTPRVCPHPEATPYSAAGAGSASKAMGLSGAGGSSSLGHPIPEQTEKTGVAGSQSQRGSKRAEEREKGRREGEKEEQTKKW